MRFRSQPQVAPLEEGMVTHSSILAWKIPWTEESGWLQSMGLQRVSCNSARGLTLLDGGLPGSPLLPLHAQLLPPCTARGYCIILEGWSLSPMRPQQEPELHPLLEMLYLKCTRGGRGDSLLDFLLRFALMPPRWLHSKCRLSGSPASPSFLPCFILFTVLTTMWWWCLVPQSCPTLCNPMDCSPPGSSVHGTSQARILERVAIFLLHTTIWKSVKCLFSYFSIVRLSNKLPAELAHAPRVFCLLTPFSAGSTRWGAASITESVPLVSSEGAESPGSYHSEA